jgi:calcineurin-like phosphoesterase family protein
MAAKRAIAIAQAVAVAAAASALAGCEPPPDSVFLHPYPWEDAAPATDAGGDVGDAEATAAAGGTDAGAPAPGQPYTIVALPDTQYYASEYPDIFDAQTRWIVGERALGNVAVVVHEGDVVDANNDTQWARADRSLGMLDGLVPYVLSTGNHDYQGDGWTTGRGTLIDTFFPVSRFAKQSWFKGTFDADHIENNYALIDLPGGGGQWLVVSLEFGPRDEVLAWADGVVKQYPTTPAIVVTHAYLYEDNSRYDHVASPHQPWNPHAYPFGSLPTSSTSVNDGEEIWQKLIAPNSNIEFVLCGHVLDQGVGRRTDVRPDGTVVHQLLANYQMLDLGGGGYLRVMQFFPATRQVHVRTYSPYLNTSKTDPANDFVLQY